MQLSKDLSKKLAVKFLLLRRIKILQASLAIACLLLGGHFAELSGVFGSWWLGVGASALMAAAIVEPHYTHSSSAMLYGFGAIGAFWSANRKDVELLWNVYLSVAIVVCLASVAAEVLSHENRWRVLAASISTQFGRPLVLGFTAIAIFNLRLAGTGPLDNAVSFCLGWGIAAGIVAYDWRKLVATVSFRDGSIASVLTAVDPNLILVSTDQRYETGRQVKVSGIGTSRGFVVSNLANKHGNRVQIVLDEPWVSVVATGGSPCLIELAEEQQESPAGFAVEGSTERSLHLNPLKGLKYGEVVFWEDAKFNYLYQVTGLQLERDIWDSSAVVKKSAVAVQLGSFGSDRSLGHSRSVPAAHQHVKYAKNIKLPLPTGFVRIGVIPATGIEVGVSPAKLRSHHLAILGMSGMGKSTVSRHICDALSAGSFLVAADGTGEYRTRFGFDCFDPDKHASSVGQWVFEPGGGPAPKATELIKSMMTLGQNEYKAGTPFDRTLLLEEAHSFLPEWNFASSPDESRKVSESCRYILQSRKFGLSFVFVSQRTAVISKSALSQCESYIFFRTLDASGLDYIEAVAGREMREPVASLSRYQAVCVGPAFNTTSPAIVDLDPYVELCRMGQPKSIEVKAEIDASL